MRPRRLLLLIVIALGVIAAGWFCFRRNDEPKYEGRPVSYWFRIVTGHYDTDGRGRDALVAMGTNAVPFLIKEALDTNEDSLVKIKLIDFYYKYGDKLPIPEVASRDWKRTVAASVLSGINIPPEFLLAQLRQPLTGTNRIQQIRAVQILEEAREQSPALIPAFQTVLKSPDKRARMTAGYALGKLGGDGNSAIPALKAAFETEADPDVQFEIAFALIQLDEHQTNALVFLTNLLDGAKTVNRLNRIARRFGRIGTNGLKAAPVLLQKLQETNADLWEASCDALKKVGVSNSEILPVIDAHLNSVSDQERYTAASLILALTNSDPAALKVLVGLTKEPGEYQDRAIERLRGAGANAAAVIPELRELEGMSNRVIGYKVKIVLRNLGAEDAEGVKK